MNTQAQLLCPCCGSTNFTLVKGEHLVDRPDGVRIVVPNVEKYVCGNCGETALSLEATEQIESYIAQAHELLSGEELTRIRKRFGLDQKDMSEVLGLGAKSYHRWEKGTQTLSRSMAFYVRVLDAFPEAFEWLRSRRWRSEAKIIEVDFAHAFPSRERALKGDNLQGHRPTTRNPARALVG